MTDSKPELKPCPFCGGKARTARRTTFNLHHVQCDLCDASQAGQITEQRAIDAWNTRAVNSQDELVQALKAVRFNLITFAGYKVNSIQIEGIDAALAKVQS